MNDFSSPTPRLAGRYVGAPAEPGVQGVYTAATRPARTPGSYVANQPSRRSRFGRYTAIQFARLLTATGSVRTLTGSIHVQAAR